MTHSLVPPLLFVEDDEDQLFLFSAVFEGLGFKVLTCSSVVEALNIHQATNLLCIIVDLMMPDGGGSRLITELKGIARDSAATVPPVIILSAAEKIYMENLLEQGAYACCTKQEINTRLVQLVSKLRDESCSL